MKKIRAFFRGACFALNGIKVFYKTPDLWKYSLIPLGLVLLAYAALIAAGCYSIKLLTDFFAEICTDLPDYLQWLATAASSVSAIALFLIFIVIAVISLGTLYELFGGLFFDALIHRFSKKLCPEKLNKTDWKFNLQAVVDSIVYGLVTLFWITVTAVINIFIPFVGQIIGAIIVSYRFGVSYLALSGFHYRWSLQKTRKMAYKNFMLTFGYGSIIYLLFLFPAAIIFTLPGLILGGVLLLNDGFTDDF